MKCSTELNRPPRARRDATPTSDVSTYRPGVDILEQDGNLLLLADVPGADESSIDVAVENNVLSIKGEINRPELDGYRLVWSEASTGSFERSFTIPTEIDLDGIEAAVTNGVLRVTLPRSPEKGTKRIEVKSD